MANVLSDEKKQQVLALGRLGWSLRKIEGATGIRRETASAYLRAASIAIRAPRQVGPPSKPATAGEGPMVRLPETGKYRRTRLFVFTLGHSRKSIRLISFRSSSRIWAELHERCFRRLGGAPRVVVLDNLREGVIKADFYDPTLNPL